MSEELPDADTVPGAGSGDAAPTREIPRVSPPAKKSPAKKAPASAQTPVTDKGRTREIPHVPAPPKPVTAPKETTSQKSADKTLSEPTAPVPQAKPAPKDEPTQTVQPVTGPTGRTLTAADYAKTTNPSPSTTAVMPAVRDDAGTGRQMTFSESETHGRRASLRLTRVEPWSVTRLAFAISVAMMIVGVVAVTIFWLVLEATGVWDQINDSVTSVLSDDSSTFSITDYLGFGRMVGLTLVLSAINVVLMTALATIGAHLYNIAADLLGGIEVTFSEEK